VLILVVVRSVAEWRATAVGNAHSAAVPHSQTSLHKSATDALNDELEPAAKIDVRLLLLITKQKSPPQLLPFVYSYPPTSEFPSPSSISPFRPYVSPPSISPPLKHLVMRQAASGPIMQGYFHFHFLVDRFRGSEATV